MKRFMTPAVIALLVMGCARDVNEEPLNLATNNQQGPLSFRGEGGKVVDGRRYFSSLDALQSYYTLLEKEFSMVSNDDEAEFFFATVEQGYASLRRKTYVEEYAKIPTKEQKLNETDFLKDDLRKALLNEYHEVGVGDRVYVFYSDNQLYSIPAKDEATIEAFRALKKYANAPIPLEVLTPKVELVTEGCGFGLGDPNTVTTIVKGGDGGPLGPRNSVRKTVTYHPAGSFDNVDCLVFAKDFRLTLAGQVKEWDDMNTPDSTADDTLLRQYPIAPIFSSVFDYGDGVTQSFPAALVRNTTYVYSAMGSYNASAVLTYQDLDGNTQTSTVNLGAVLVNESCSQQNVNKELWRDAGTNRNLRACIWFKHDIFGTHAGSFSKSYYWNTNRQTWKLEKTELYTEINATFRNNNCQPTATEFANKDCSNCNSRRKACTVTGAQRRDISNGDIFSHHTLSDNGVTITQDLVLNPCE